MDYDVRVWLFILAFGGAVIFAFLSARGHRLTLLGALAGLWLLDIAAISQAGATSTAGSTATTRARRRRSRRA